MSDTPTLSDAYTLPALERLIEQLEAEQRLFFSAPTHDPEEMAEQNTHLQRLIEAKKRRARVLNDVEAACVPAPSITVIQDNRQVVFNTAVVLPESPTVAPALNAAPDESLGVDVDKIMDVAKLRKLWEAGHLTQVNGKQALAIIDRRSEETLSSWEDRGDITRVTSPDDRIQLRKWEEAKKKDPDARKPKIDRVYTADSVFFAKGYSRKK